MNSDNGSTGPEQGASATEIERDIEATREQLEDTVEALAGKLDVKAQAKQKADDLKVAAQHGSDRVRAEVGRNWSERPTVVVGAAVAAAAIITGVVALVTRHRD